MDILLFSNAWHEQALARQIALGLASVATVLLFIFAALSIFGKPDADAPKKTFIAPRLILPFVAFAAWGIVIGLHRPVSNFTIIALGFGLGMIGVAIARLIMWVLRQLLNHGNFDIQHADQSTGKALKTIPPHRNGFGAVHLNMREAPFAIEAITSGKAISPGTPVRVVGIIDEKVVLVEPIDKDDPASSPSPD